MSKWLGGFLLAFALVFAACAGTEDAGDRLQVVATTTVLGDVLSSIVGSDGTVEVLLPIGADPHAYQPSSQQVAAIQEADLVVANGLGLEEGLADVLENATRDGANVLEIAALLEPIPLASADESLDPHVWLDPVRMAQAAGLIGEKLSELDESVEWAARAELYSAELLNTAEEMRTILEPVVRRQLVTNHDSLGYLAARFDFEVIGTVIPGGATLAEPSSAGLARLVEQIESLRVPAIFAETTEPTALAEAIAAEVGRDVAVVELFTGSLGEPESGAETLQGMLITNAQRIAEALS